MDMRVRTKERDDAYLKRLKELEKKYSWAGDCDVETLFQQGTEDFDRVVGVEKDQYFDMVPAAPRALVSDVDDIDEYECADVEGAPFIPDGSVTLIIFGREEVLVNEADGCLPHCVVQGGAWATVCHLAERLMGKEVDGIKKIGEIFVEGNLVFVYVVPIHYSGCQLLKKRWATLNDALSKKNSEGLKFLVGTFPRLHLLNEHWRRVVDYDQLGEVRRRLAHNDVTPVTLMTALVNSHPIHLLSMMRWMKLLGYDVPEEAMKQYIQDEDNALLLDKEGNVYLDSINLSLKWTSDVANKMLSRTKQRKWIGKAQKAFSRRWKRGMEDCETTDPYHYFDEYHVSSWDSGPHPRPGVLQMLNYHPYVEITKKRPAKGWWVGSWDPGLRRACGHGDLCEHYCVHESRHKLLLYANDEEKMDDDGCGVHCEVIGGPWRYEGESEFHWVNYDDIR